MFNVERNRFPLEYDRFDFKSAHLILESVEFNVKMVCIGKRGLQESNFGEASSVNIKLCIALKRLENQQIQFVNSVKTAMEELRDSCTYTIKQTNQTSTWGDF